MALPVFERTYTIATATGGNTGNGDNDNRDGFLMWKDLLVASGHWSVIGSSNNTTYGMDGVDRWTTYSDLGASRWIVLENTNIGAAGKFQLRLQMNASSTTTEAPYLWFSAGGLFEDTGSMSMTVAPLATDELYAGGSFLSWPTGAGERKVVVWTSDDGQALRSITKEYGSTINSSMLYIDVVADSRSTWTDNWIFAWFTPTISNLAGGGDNVWKCNLDDFPSEVRITGEGNAHGYLVQQTDYQSVDLNGEWFTQPITGFLSDTLQRSGIWGRPIDLFIAPPAIPSMTEFPSTGNVTHIKFQDLILPWDNSPLP